MAIIIAAKLLTVNTLRKIEPEFSAQSSVKGAAGSRRRSAAAGEHRTGEDAGKAVPLTGLGAHPRSRQGGRYSKRSAAPPAPLTTEGDSLPSPLAGKGGGMGINCSADGT